MSVSVEGFSSGEGAGASSANPPRQPECKDTQMKNEIIANQALKESDLPAWTKKSNARFADVLHNKLRKHLDLSYPHNTEYLIDRFRDVVGAVRVQLMQEGL